MQLEFCAIFLSCELNGNESLAEVRHRLSEFMKYAAKAFRRSSKSFTKRIVTSLHCLFLHSLIAKQKIELFVSFGECKPNFNYWRFCKSKPTEKEADGDEDCKKNQ